MWLVAVYKDNLLKSAKLRAKLGAAQPAAYYGPFYSEEAAFEVAQTMPNVGMFQVFKLNEPRNDNAEFWQVVA